jgi:mevalonate kinase
VKATAISPAKTILFGEHFVVNGNTAISMAIDLPTKVQVETILDDEITVTSHNLALTATFRTESGELVNAIGRTAEETLRPVFETAKFTLDKYGVNTGLSITVTSKVPIGMGLGSSAATAVATVSSISAVLKKRISRQETFEAAYSLEKIIHGRPSGVDQATVTFGGLLTFRRGHVESHMTPTTPPILVIGNTGRRRSTGELVSKVTELRQNDPRRYDQIASDAEQIANRAVIALNTGDSREVGRLMNQNQELLELVGVSSPELQKLIFAARASGALGAKLTGGGGGGCMIALTTNHKSNIAEAIQEAGGEVLLGAFMPEGVKISIDEER